MEREALKLALEALELNNDEWKSLADSGDAGFWNAEDQDHYRQTNDAITAIKAALAQPEPDMLTIAYQSGYHDGKKAALAGREWNFCERCGKRTADKTAIHTCTPPQEGK